MYPAVKGSEAVVSNGESAVSFINTNNFSLTNCKLETTNSIPLLIKNSKDGQITGNTIGKFYVSVYKSSNLRFKKNILGAFYQQEYSTDNVLQNNTLSVTLDPTGSFGTVGAVVVSTRGARNQIVNNLIDGKAEGVFDNKNAADDGIVIDQETADVVEGNTIANNWDCGIETFGHISKSRIARNYIKNSGVCGIGGWYYNSWKGNEVSENTIDDAPTMFLFARMHGLRPAGWDVNDPSSVADEYVYFADNRFVKNKFINAKLQKGSVSQLGSSVIFMTPSGDLGNILGERVATKKDFILGNNLFQENDFGTALNAPHFDPMNMIVDGGGNICGKATDNYPLKCGQ